MGNDWEVIFVTWQHATWLPLRWVIGCLFDTISPVLGMSSDSGKVIIHIIKKKCHCVLTNIYEMSLRKSWAATATIFFFLWWLVNCSRRLWLIIAHASDCIAPDNDGSMDLSLLPHGLLLNDSGVMSTADCDMIHVVFSWVKFVWDPPRHLSPRCCCCSLLCLPLSHYGRKKEDELILSFFPPNRVPVSYI